MSALMRFLNRDSAAKAVVVTLVSAAAIAAVPNEPASGGQAAPAAFSAPGRTLVLLDMAARRLDAAVALLDGGTRLCLAEQGRLLGPDALGSGRADASASAAARRAETLAFERADGRAGHAVREAASDPGLTPGQRERLLHHAGLRDACLAWAERSIDVVRDRLGRPGPDMAELKGMAERDAGFVRFIAVLDPARTDAIEAMETYGPRR